jgi:hypothetical protein
MEGLLDKVATITGAAGGAGRLPVSGTLHTPQLTRLQVLSSRHRSGYVALRISKGTQCHGSWDARI